MCQHGHLCPCCADSTLILNPPQTLKPKTRSSSAKPPLKTAGSFSLPASLVKSHQPLQSAVSVRKMLAGPVTPQEAAEARDPPHSPLPVEVGGGAGGGGGGEGGHGHLSSASVGSGEGGEGGWMVEPQP